MWIPKKALVSALVAGVAAISMALAVAAAGHDNSKGGDRGDHHRGDRGRHDGAFVRASLAPSQPTDPTFHGVKPGGAPWVLKNGEVRVKRQGGLDLRVRGLLISAGPASGTTGPVKSISASLYCGADADTTAADTTPQVPLSSGGDAQIHDSSFTVPATCLAPVILVNPNGDTTRYISVDGRRG